MSVVVWTSKKRTSVNGIPRLIFSYRYPRLYQRSIWTSSGVDLKIQENVQDTETNSGDAESRIRARMNPSTNPRTPEMAVSLSVSTRPLTTDCAVNHCATTPHSQRGLVARDQATARTPSATTAVPTQRHGCFAATTR